jgi:hypothetical protein
MPRLWSQEYDSYVSKSYSFNRLKNNPFKISLHKCNILITRYGFFYLRQKSKLIKRLSLEEYLKFKNYVQEVVNEGYPLN